MSKCDQQFLVVDYFFSELSSDEKLKFENHLKNCTTCQQYLDALATTSGVIKKQEREQPDKELLKNYQLHLKKEFYAKKNATSWIDKILEKFIRRPSVGLRLAEAVVFILVGIFIGKLTIWKSVTPNAPVEFNQVSYDPSIKDLLLDNYLQETEMIFLDVANLDPIEDQKIILTLIQSAKYKYLMQKTLLLRDQAKEVENQQLSDLLNQIELILLELYNMETNSYNETLSIVQQQLKRSHLLLEIKSLNKMDI